MRFQVFWTLPSYVENPNLEFFCHYHCGAFLDAYLCAWQVFEYYILRSKSLHWIGMVIIIHFLFPPYHSLLQVFYCWLISWKFPWVPQLCWRCFQTWSFLILRLWENWATGLLSVCLWLSLETPYQGGHRVIRVMHYRKVKSDPTKWRAKKINGLAT